ncbi:UvrD-helicase domain-containing protein [Solicola sp. PLA-1-18]|uniref:UvrD-helicase domain-containing protein n=1 Tax=Solicola sp. PLA-1-18 TaxID=3380532 RepID=UPI003B77E529
MTGTGVRTRLLRDVDHLCRVLGVRFSDEQLAAITAPKDAPCVVVAGAGSGKTTVMAARVVWLVGRGEVAPGSVLGLTFTTKAAAELAQRVRGALELLADDAGIADFLDEAGSPTVSTYHAYAGTLIAEFGPLLGYEPDLQVVSDASRHQRAIRAVTSHRGRVEHLTTHVPTLVSDVLALDGQMADHLVDPEVVRAWGRELRAHLAGLDEPVKDVPDVVAASHKRDELLTFVELYRQAKAQAGVVDFSDQMAWGARLALSCPEVSSAQRERYEVVLLDEYQDTSVAQRDMLQGLFSGADVARGRGHSVTAVGDPCQGIYGWRGAAADNLTGFLDDFPAADGATGAAHGLRVNRRCAAEVLDVANTLAAPYYATSEHVQPLVAPPEAATGTVRAALLPTVADEVEWVADQVAALPEPDGDGPRWSRAAVLVREKSEIASLVAALRARRIPVEVVGLAGLLRTPEVQDVRATLDVLGDVCANGSLLRLLTGPRFNLGPRDLALLGRRARQLAGGGAPAGDEDLATTMLRAVQGQDPSEVLALYEAVDDPGQTGYSAEAAERVSELASLLRGLRRHVGEPLADLTRRVVTALDLDVELGARGGPTGEVARDNLSAFVDVVGEFQAREPGASLGALLAYLRAEDDYEDGLEVATPSADDSVKVLTAHKAKGLEWDVVLVPFLSEQVFPSAKARPRWTRTASELPAALRGDAHLQPDVHEWTRAGIDAYHQEGRDDAAMEELRLGYVAFTRARHELVVSGHVWGRTQVKPRGPSAYLTTVRQWLRHRGRDAERWAETPAVGTPNPLAAEAEAVSWPSSPHGPWLDRRRAAAEAVAAHVGSGVEPAALPEPDRRLADSADAWRRLEQIDADLPRLLAEAADAEADVVEVPLPASLSTTALMRLRRDEKGFVRDLVRPMPRPPAASARFGTRFHAWIEAHLGQQLLLDEGDLPGRHHQDIEDEAELAALTEAFAAGPYGSRDPFAVEVPFSTWIGDRQVVGRIDAVYEGPDGWEVVDWKTSRRADADPWQLAVYRLAWAEAQGVDPGDVDAAFYYVRRDEVVRPAGLPGRAELEAVLSDTGRGGTP